MTKGDPTLSAEERHKQLLATLTPERIAADQRKFERQHLEEAVDRHVEAIAKARGYVSEANLASWVTSSNPEWAADATAFVAWRDAAWTVAYEMIALAEGNGTKIEPSALVANLPKIVWPN